MLLYIRGKEHGKDLLDSVLNGPFQYGTIEVPGTPTSPASTRPRTYDNLTNKEKIHEECDIRATNIVLQGLQPDVYTLVNHHTVAKEIWDRVKLLIEGTKLLLQERESKLYNEFDRFTSEKGETIHVTHSSTIILYTSCSSNISGYQAPVVQQQSSAVFLQLDSGLGVQSFLSTNDLINSLNKAMSFISIGHGAECVGKKAQGYAGSGAKVLILDEEQLAFLADLGDRVDSGPDTQTLPNTAIFQTDDLDAFDSDCDEAPSASAVLMAKLFAYDSDVLFEVPNYNIYQDKNVMD
ncbi:hypothetical protein Tco_1078439 [Tanacetum coccineum]|uniref:Integrase, catalytic region, zinc finger, CCHC-type, peptidase aspartic, catalytic n=1 Tax=Tanacetum coccineum TaxID=301880 RepID=A0ABQ5HQB0_9ASTR